jgi:anti-sigma factor RsiW
MAGLENEMAAEAGRGRLRASHADREHVVGTLKAAYVHGLVTKDEFDAKVSQAFASRTYAELALITTDIPAGLAAAPPAPRPSPATANPPAHANLTPGERAMIGTGLLAALAIVVGLLAGGVVGGLLALGAVGSAFVSAFLLGAQVRSSRRNRHSGGHLPPQRVTHRRMSRPS